MLIYPNQQDAMKVLEKASTAKVLPVITPVPADATSLANYNSQISTYVAESYAKFITGQTAITDANFNTYIATLKTLNLDKALAIEQKALETYNKR